MSNILIIIDIQKEYITLGRPFHLNGIDDSLTRASAALKFARDNGWDIVHVQHSNGEHAEKFNPTTEHYDFVEGFEPIQGEMHFIKNDFSCYASREFSLYMDKKSLEGSNVYVMGYNSVMCCLSTLEEARRKGHKMNFINDASLAKRLDGLDEIESHKVMLSIYRAKGLASITSVNEVMQRHSPKVISNVSLFKHADDRALDGAEHIASKVSVLK